MVKISAIISTYNRAQYLPGLFQSILEQTVVIKDYEIVIVNNNSTDTTEEESLKFIKANPSIKISYCVETQQGLSFGRNRGIKESNGKYLTFLDDDAVLSPKFFEETISFFEKHNTVTAIGGKILLKYLCGKPSWYNPYLASLLGYFNIGDKEQSFNNDYFRGSNMSFKTDLFEKHGAFNTKLGRVGRQLYGNEEKELFYRFKEAGEEMWYVPSAVVFHLVPYERTTTNFIRKQGIGTGISQRQQAQVKGKSSELITILTEMAKWIATGFLSLWYFITFRFAVAVMLIRFRAWVSYGMLCQNSAAKAL